MEDRNVEWLYIILQRKQRTYPLQVKRGNSHRKTSYSAVCCIFEKLNDTDKIFDLALAFCTNT